MTYSGSNLRTRNHVARGRDPPQTSGPARHLVYTAEVGSMSDPSPPVPPPQRSSPSPKAPSDSQKSKRRGFVVDWLRPVLIPLIASLMGAAAIFGVRDMIVVPERIGGAWSCRVYEDPYIERLSLERPLAYLNSVMVEDDSGNIHGAIAQVVDSETEQIMPTSHVTITGRRNNYVLRRDDLLITVPVADEEQYLFVLKSDGLGSLKGHHFFSRSGQELKRGGTVCLRE